MAAEGTKGTNGTNGDGLRSSVSLSQRINTGNYGHADVFLAVSNIGPDTTPEQMDEIMDQTNLGFQKIRERIKAQVAKIKAEAGI